MAAPNHRTLKLGSKERYAAHFFSIFLPQNTFSQRLMASLSAIQTNLTLHKSRLDVVAAIGALHSASEISSNSRGLVHDALHFYSDAMKALGLEIAKAQQEDLPNHLWSSFLLALFELMCSDSGEGWLQHMSSGTAKILQCLTPEACRSGVGREVLLEMRIFEIARAMLFSKPSFLATSHWSRLVGDLWLDSYIGEWHPFEVLLTLMTLISDLCFRTYDFLHKHPTSARDDAKLSLSLNEFALEGFHRRLDLAAWKSTAQEWPISEHTDHQMMLAWTYYSAVSIYLSGIYDYSDTWAIHNILTSTLDASEIERNVNSIIDMSILITTQRRIAGLALLLPLRIAGARAKRDKQREIISALIAIVKRTYKAAAAFHSDLTDVWGIL